MKTWQISICGASGTSDETVWTYFVDAKTREEAFRLCNLHFDAFMPEEDCIGLHVRDLGVLTEKQWVITATCNAQGIDLKNVILVQAKNHSGALEEYSKEFGWDFSRPITDLKVEIVARQVPVHAVK